MRSSIWKGGKSKKRERFSGTSILWKPRRTGEELTVMAERIKVTGTKGLRGTVLEERRIPKGDTGQFITTDLKTNSGGEGRE